MTSTLPVHSLVRVCFDKLVLFSACIWMLGGSRLNPFLGLDSPSKLGLFSACVGVLGAAPQPLPWVIIEKLK